MVFNPFQNPITDSMLREDAIERYLKIREQCARDGGLWPQGGRGLSDAEAAELNAAYDDLTKAECNYILDLQRAITMNLDIQEHFETGTLQTFAQRCIEVSVEHGFDVPTWLNFPSKLMFVISEIDEASLTNDVSSLSEELADIMIRTISILQGVSPYTWSDPRAFAAKLPLPLFRGSAPELFWPFIRRTVQALKAWREGGDGHADARINLEYLVRDVWYFAENFSIDLDAAMRSKFERNKQRPYLHGKKESAG